MFLSVQNNQEIAVAIKTYKVEPEKEQEDATRSEKFLEEACKLRVPFFFLLNDKLEFLSVTLVTLKRKLSEKDFEKQQDKNYWHFLMYFY